MHMVINISLDLLIEIGCRLTSSLWRELWVVIYCKKIHLLLVMDFRNQKIWTSRLIKTSQNEYFYFYLNSKFVI
jgi:hypothetical protein